MRFGGPDPHAASRDVQPLPEVLASGQPRLTMLSDELGTCRSVIRQLSCEVMLGVTSDWERRDAGPLPCPVKQVDSLLRHGGAHHKRQTIAWSRRRQACADSSAPT